MLWMRCAVFLKESDILTLGTQYARGPRAPLPGCQALGRRGAWPELRTRQAAVKHDIASGLRAGRMSPIPDVRFSGTPACGQKRQSALG